MSTPRLKPALAIALGTLLIAAISGCDAKENADLANGRLLFKSDCGTCHALKEAGTTATIGPDLDAAFAASRAAGMDQDTIEGVVTDQIAEPRVTATDDPAYMPPKILEGQEADDVAAYVASVAGVPGIESAEAPGGPGGQVFADNGCGACHTLATSASVGNVGPNLDDELPGQSAAVIRESIVDPNAEITSGFAANVMPGTYGDSIPAADLDKLVNYLTTCAGVGSSAGGEIDPAQFAEDGSCSGAAGGGKKK